jgi:WD40 repeat protein
MKNEKVIVGLASGSVELRNIFDLSRVNRKQAHSEPVRAICYSEKYNKIISGGEDGRIVIYDENLNQLKTIELHNRWIWQIIELTDKYLLTVACDGNIGLVDIESLSVYGKIEVPSQRIWKAVTVSSSLFLASEDGILWKCSLDSIIGLHRPKWEVSANIQEPIKACCSYGDKILLGCRDGKLYLMNERGVRLLAREDVCIRDICSIENSNKIITVGDSGIAHIYDVFSEKSIGEFKVQSSRTWMIDTLTNGIAVTIGDDRTIHLWDVNENVSLRRVFGNGQSLRGIDKIGDNKILACADDFLRIQIGNQIVPWGTRRIRKRIMGVISLDENKWACSFEDGIVWLGKNEKTLIEINAHKGAIESIARSKDGTLFATGGEDRVIRVFDSLGNTQKSPQTLHNSRIWSLAFSPNQSKLASAGGDFIIALWDVKTGNVAGSCTGHNNLILALSWLDNGKIASAGTDGTIRLWDVSSSTCIMMEAIPSLIRGLTTNGNGVVYGVGRNLNSDPGWVIVKWDTKSRKIDIKPIDIVGGSARSLLYDADSLYVGGDMPVLVKVDPESLEVISKTRIPGIYYGMTIDANKSVGVDIDSLALLGADIGEVNNDSCDPPA